MTHARQLLRDRAVYLLEQGNLGADDIRATRARAIDQKQGAWISVFTDREVSAEMDTDDRLERIVELKIHIETKGAADQDDRCDDFAEQVEAILKPGALPGAWHITLTGSNGPDVDRSAEFERAALLLTFNVTYRTSVGDASQFL